MSCSHSGKDKTQLQVNAIREGTVIDHIPPQNLFKVISILNLHKITTQITFGTNFDSQRMGKKALIKIEGVFFTQEEINKIALVAPSAKLNLIKNYEVVQKLPVSIPDKVSGIIKCYNPNCVTNHEKVTTLFHVVENHPIMLKCHFCEKVMTEEHFIFI
ncbi:MAG: aspartate carbamoyltransferase regulatory subunit [Bacteroidales bacterium]|nr:aspartate carbamoyltransferase regulatory subunit [Bacteroidales bacterium]HOK99852.1 aspartate carbamoyltransferase regulatory subunit [Bacteroidales bacterium]HPO66646.1 aspartate carbamoyltransferase regulatory subunit [Bacteroidales bacterium]